MFEATPSWTSIVSDPVRGLPVVIVAVAIIKVLTVVVIRADVDLLINGRLNRNLLFVWFAWRLKVKESFVCEFLVLHIWVS